MTPLHIVVITYIVLCAGTWILSLVTNEHSWVDRIWSIAPILYVGEIAQRAHFHNVRLNVMALLILLWCARLTFNFARKGGYSGTEDYRWPVLRASMKPWQFQIFNFFFIVLYQNFLLVLISLPALNAYNHQGTIFNGWDALLVVIFILFLAGETLADQEQWDFQQTKKGIIEHGGTPEERFISTGLFRYSRHPNYFFELALWWVFFLIGCVAADSVVQRTIIGPILLVILFIGSTQFTEKLSLQKYPEYAQYQKSTSAVVPWMSKNSLS